MPHRLAALVPLILVALLAGCASTPARSIATAQEQEALGEIHARLVHLESELEEARLEALARSRQERQVERLLEQGFKLVGTRYRYGGTTVKTGFDCSGFIGYLFRNETGLHLPRSTRQMIRYDAPKVARDELEPGDIVFFATRRKGRVDHAGIYIGDNRFIHSASRRSGVRVDRLDQGYWAPRYLQAKRVLNGSETLNLAQLTR